MLAGYGRGADSQREGRPDLDRFTAAGALGPDLRHRGGVTRIDIAKDDDRARNLLVLPDDRILVAGSGKKTAADVDGMVVLLDKDGKPVTTFGDGGKVISDLGGPADSWYGVTLASDDGSVVVVGYKGADANAGGNDDAAIARLALTSE